MAKYAVHTKWSWSDGVPSAETMQGWHREHRSNTKAEDIIGLRLTKTLINQLLFILLKKTLKKRGQSYWNSAKKTAQQMEIQLLSKLWDQFSQLCQRYKLFTHRYWLHLGNQFGHHESFEFY